MSPSRRFRRPDRFRGSAARSSRPPRVFLAFATLSAALAVVVFVALRSTVASRAGDERMSFQDANAPILGAATDPSSSPTPSTSPAVQRPPDVQGKAPRGTDVYTAMTGGLSKRVAHVPTRIYVPNNGSNSVTVIDPRTYRVIRTFRVGLGPQHITPSWNLQHLYVGNTYSNTLTEIDPRSGRPVHTIPVIDPYNLYFTPDGSLAIDVAERLQMLYLYDPKSWRRVGAIRIPFAGVDHLDFSADGRYLLVSAEFSGTVAKVNIARRRIIGTLHVGGSPVDVKLSPYGSVFYVANQERSGVSIIDPATMKETNFLHTGAGAHGFCISRDTTELYVSNRLAGTISVIDFATRRVTQTWNVGGSPDMLQVSADGTLLWVSNRYDGTVSVVSTRTGHVLHTIRVGSDPHGLTLFPQPGRFSIGHNGVYR
jgi:YVTN family beta-propeller protein